MGSRLARAAMLATFLVGHQERGKPLLVWLLFLMPSPVRRWFVRWWIMTHSNKPRVPFRQVLDATTLHPNAIGARFYAVIIDPETQKRVCEVPIYELRPGEVVELALERLSIFNKGQGYHEVPT